MTSAPPPRRGGSSLLKVLVVAMAVLVLGMVLVSRFTQVGDTSPFETQPNDTPPIDTPVAEYQNESYQVPPIELNPPPLPMPETYGQAADWLTTNPIYDSEISAPVRCEATPIDLEKASSSDLKKHFNELTGCLMRVFAPAVEDAGFVAVRPSVTIYSAPVETRCGTMPLQNATYCAGDQQIYYAIDLPVILPTQLRHADYAVESVIAHEFAHAIQARTGVLISEAAWEQNSAEPEANAFSRRLEVQADCWAGQFINSVGLSVGVDAEGMQQLSLIFFSIGDDQLTGDPFIEGNHGRGESRQTWFLDGTNSTAMGTCNTFAAPDDQVR